MELLHFCYFLFILGQAASSHPKLKHKNCGRVRPISSNRIVGGEEAVVGAWPWMVAVLIRGNGIVMTWCGGSLITNNYVLTAAHCMERNGTIPPLTWYIVRIGAHDLKAGGSRASHEDMDIEVVVKHSKFNPKTYENDICLLKLKKTVQFRDRVQPVCLPYDDLRTTPLAGRNAFAIGWGRTREVGTGSSLLMEVQVPIWEQARCVEAYKKLNWTITGVSFCAGYEDGVKDACMGDSGGPLMLYGKGGRFYVVGIVSFGEGCARPNFPGVYTNVRKFLPWLSKHLK